MAVLKVIESYDGRLPVYNVVKEVSDCSNITRDKIIKSFDTYEEAEAYCNNLIKSGKIKDGLTCCGEEDPCE